MIVFVEGRETRARSSLFICIRFLRFNVVSVLRIEGRSTLKNVISSRLDGNCLFSLNLRRRIICFSFFFIISESFLRVSGRLRKLRLIVGEEFSVCELNAFIRFIL